MRPIILPMVLAAGLLATASAQAQTATTVTATCKDGSAFSGATRTGACRGHGGVQTWGDAGASTKIAPTVTPSKTPTAAAATAPAAAPVAPAARPPSAGTPAVPASKPPNATTAAAGGGVGQVWVNTSSKIYHCSTDKWYGKTKEGTYMLESDAKAKGYRPDLGKACS